MDRICLGVAFLGAVLSGLTVIVTSQTTSAPSEDFIPNEQRLYETLMKNYNRFLRPAKYANDTVHVRYGLALLEINSIEELSGNMDIMVWKRMTWTDFRFSWTPSDFGGIQEIRIPGNQIWRPDIVNYVRSGPEQDVNAVISSNGVVLLIAPGMEKLKCSLDWTYFPADKQTCWAKFGSWTYDGLKVKLYLFDGLKEIDLNDYRENNELRIVSHPAYVSTVYYSCCPQPYEHIAVRLTVERMTSQQYLSRYLAPGIILALLAPLLFILPSGDPHRFNMGGALLMTLTIIMGIVAREIPVDQYPPLIAKYFSGLFVVVSLSLALSTLTTNLAHRRTKLAPMPGILKMIMKGLAWPLCVNLDTSVYDKMEVLHSVEEDSSTAVSVQSSQGDWRVMAAVLDRLFCLLFLLATIIMSAVILPQIMRL